MKVLLLFALINFATAADINCTYIVFKLKESDIKTQATLEQTSKKSAPSEEPEKVIKQIGQSSNEKEEPKAAQESPKISESQPKSEKKVSRGTRRL